MATPFVPGWIGDLIRHTETKVVLLLDQLELVDMYLCRHYGTECVT